MATLSRPVGIRAGSRSPSRGAIWAALIAVYLFWGSTFLGIRLAIESFPPFLLAGARFALAGAILYAFARLRGAPKPTRTHWLWAGVVGLTLLVAGNGTVAWTEQTLPSGLVALMVSSSPLWMVILDRIFNGVSLTWPRLLGVVVGLAGIFILVNPSGAGAALFPLVLLTISSIAWAVGTLASRSRSAHPSAPLSNGMSMLAGAAGLAAVGLGTGEFSRVSFQHVHPVSVVAAAWLVVAGSLIGFSCYLWLLRVAPVVLVATQSYVSPIVAVALGALLVGEHITSRSLVAGAVIVFAVVLIATAPLLAPERRPDAVREEVAA